MDSSLFFSTRQNTGNFWTPNWQQSAYDAAPDATPGWNAMLASLSGADTTARVSPGKGVYAFKTKPNPIPLALRLEGDGPSWDGTVFLKGYSDTSFGNENGMVGFAPGGGMGARVSGILMKAMAGTTGGCLIGATSQLGGGNTFLQLDRLYLTSDPPEGGIPLVDYMINFDGTLQSAGAQGIRTPFWSRIIAFGGKWGAGRLVGAESPKILDCDFYPGGTGDARLIIGGTSIVHSANPTVRMGSLTGLTLSYLDGGRFDLTVFGGRISNDGFVNNIVVQANQPDSIIACDTNWSHSFINGVPR